MCRAYEKEVGIVSATLKEESYKASQLGKTVENLRANQKRLETEVMMKQSLEVELGRVQGQLTKEEGRVVQMEKKVKEREEKVKVLERNIDRLEKRRQSSDKVFAALAKEGEKENFATLNGGDLSRQELEAALVTSRPGSRLDAGSSFIQSRLGADKSQAVSVGPRRQGLSLLDHNASPKPLTGEKPLVELGNCSCDLSAQLQQVKTERDAALAKLRATRFEALLKFRWNFTISSPCMAGPPSPLQQRSSQTRTDERRRWRRPSAGQLQKPLRCQFTPILNLRLSPDCGLI